MFIVLHCIVCFLCCIALYGFALHCIFIALYDIELYVYFIALYALHCMFIALRCFVGVYLPLFWEQSFCWHVPIALGYTRGHFAALVPMEVDIFGSTGAQANISNNDDDDDDDDDVPIAYLPLMDFEGKVLPIHFLQPSEVSPRRRS